MMSLPAMTAYHLRKDEVEYELKIRGVESKGVAGELRKRLAQCFSAKTKVNEDIVNDLDPEKELETCEEKCGDLGSLVEEYDGDGKDREFQRLFARLYHLNQRVGRIPVSTTSEEELEQQKSELTVKCRILVQTLEAYKKTAEDLKKTEVINTENLTLNLVDKTEKATTEDPARDSKREDHVLEPNLAFSENLPPSSSALPDQYKIVDASLVQSRHFGTRSVPVYKWGIKFDMESGQSVGSFLERVEELRRARGLSHQELFESAVDLFSGTTLVWYRAAVRRVSSWDQLCRELKLVFQSPDYDDMLRQEIRNRVQGPEESIDLFLAAVEGLFGRLSVKVPEVERLQQVLKNLNPYLQEKLCMFEIKCMETLRELGRKAELGRLRSATHNPPPRHSRILEPDLAWGTSPRRKPPILAALRPCKAPKSSESSFKCWNCSEGGHRFSQCTKDRNLFCYGCGSPGVKKANCSACRPKNGPRGEPAK